VVPGVHTPPLLVLDVELVEELDVPPVVVT
jgi:hypothetical protein